MCLTCVATAQSVTRNFNSRAVSVTAVQAHHWGTPVQQPETTQENEQDNENAQQHPEMVTESDATIISDHEAMQQTTGKKRKKRKKRAKWDPIRSPATLHQGNRIQALRDKIRTDGSYLGDKADPTDRDDTIRIATTNVNKGTWRKIQNEIADWVTVNTIDFLILSDSDIGSLESQIWMEHEDGLMKPNLDVISTTRTSILFNSKRWSSRIIRGVIKESPQGRSICLEVRSGHKELLWIIGTYCKDCPDVPENTEEAQNEFDWIEKMTHEGRAQGATVIIAGDFNIVTMDPRDRPSTNQRSHASIQVSRNFDAMMTNLQMKPAFRVKHQTIDRYTYEVASTNTRTTIDDIYVPYETSQCVVESGIWLEDVQASDHIGVPFVDIRLGYQNINPRKLQGVQEMKSVNTRQKTNEEMKEFTTALQQSLEKGEIKLIPEPNPDAQKHEIEEWIEKAIEDIQTAMYSCAKSIWGEQTQNSNSKQQMACVKATRKCNGQLRKLLREHQRNTMTYMKIRTLMQCINWPKWVREPEKIPDEAYYKVSTTTLQQWLLLPPKN